MTELETCLLFPTMWAGPIRHHPSLQKKDALPIGTKSIVEHSEEINIGIAVLTKDVVKPELYSKNAM